MVVIEDALSVSEPRETNMTRHTSLVSHQETLWTMSTSDLTHIEQ